MNRKLLLALQKRTNARLKELQTRMENNDVGEEELEAVQTEVDELTEQAQDVADALENLEDDGSNDDDKGADDKGDDDKDEDKDKDKDKDDDKDEDDEKDDDKRGAGISSEQRSGIMSAIGKGLSTRGHKSTQTKEKEIRSAFANFVVGKISEQEARSLGVEAGNGSVTIPEVIASEIITYAQEANLLRKYGSVHRTKGEVKYPVLVKKAEANVSKKERTTDIPETEIEFDEILLDPAEFDALATVTKKLIKMSGVNVEEIVIEELKKAYVRKETNYMFNGDNLNNENPGALAKKAVPFYEVEADPLYDTLVKMKNTPVTEVINKGRWIINRAAYTAIELMKTDDGTPLMRSFTQAEGGIGRTILGYPMEFTDAADAADRTKPVFYFGDFKSFHIQDVIGALELQKLVEKYAGTNKIGFQIYNLLDGQLIYSPFEPSVYRYEVGATAPVGG